MPLVSPLSPKPAAPAASGDPVKDVGLENFVADVIEASRDRVVLVFFWAAWAEPCKVLGATLDKVVRGYKGAVHLAKIDIDQNPEISQQMRVQSVPAVFAFYRGQPVDGFMGAQPEAQLKTWLDRVIKTTGANPASEADDIAFALEQAAEFLAKGEVTTAQSIYAELLETDPKNAEAYAGILRCFIAQNDVESAKEMLAKAPPDIAKHKAMSAVRTSIELAEQSSALGDAGELETRLAQNPADHQTRFDLALVLYAQGKKESAVDQLLELVRRNRSWNEDAARKQLVKFFEAFGPSDPVTISARKRLSSILFS